MISFPRSGVGMQSEPLRRLGTQSVHHGVPTETVGTIKDNSPRRHEDHEDHEVLFLRDLRVFVVS